MSDFDDVLSRLQGPLGRINAGEAGTPELPTVRGEGSTEDEQIRVAMEGGEFNELTIDARAMRRSNAELADQILVAVNAALADHTAKVAEAMADRADLGDLQNELAQLRQDSLHAMKTYTESLFDALGQMNRINRGDT